MPGRTPPERNPSLGEAAAPRLWKHSSNWHPLRSPRTCLGRHRLPHSQHELPTTHVLQPYCNRADTHWYTMDKGKPPDRRKPPKEAQFPDTVGRARTCASKLVMSRSAVRIRSSALIFGLPMRNTRNKKGFQFIIRDLLTPLTKSSGR